MTTEIGPFLEGELPGALSHQFLDDDGVAIDLTGYSVRFVWQRVGDSTVTTRNGSLVTAASGIVGYTFVAADLATDGIYKAHWFVGNGTNRYASDPIVYRVKPALAVPAI